MRVGRRRKRNKWLDINLTYGNCVTPSAAVLGCEVGERERKPVVCENPLRFLAYFTDGGV
jgi:hypothetical protein